MTMVTIFGTDGGRRLLFLLPSRIICHFLQNITITLMRTGSWIETNPFIDEIIF